MWETAEAAGEKRILTRRAPCSEEGLSGKALIIRRKFRECDNEAPVFLPYVYQM